MAIFPQIWFYFPATSFFFLNKTTAFSEIAIKIYILPVKIVADLLQDRMNQ